MKERTGKEIELLLSIIPSYEPQRHMNIATMVNIVEGGTLNLFFMTVGMAHHHQQHIRNGICATIKVTHLAIYLLIHCLMLGILSAHRKIHKRMDTDVAFTRKYSKLSIFHGECEVY